MDLGPIIRSLRRSATRAGLLFLEVVITLALVVNCLALLKEQGGRLVKETGLDEANLMEVTVQYWDPAYRERSFRIGAADRDLASLRQLEGVANATIMGPTPLQGGGSSGQCKPMGAPASALVRTPIYTGDEQMLDTLGLELVAGRNFTAEDMPDKPGPRIANMLVTQELADVLYPDGDALGKTVDTGSVEYPDVIVGIVRHMFTPYGGGPMESRIMLYPGKPAGTTNSVYLVRAKTGQQDAVAGRVEETLATLAKERVVKVKPLLDVKAGGFVLNGFVVRVLSLIVVLLLFVTSLGVYGTASFSVAQRRKQIGTRRARGASRQRILLHFLTESSVIVVAGISVGLVAGLALNVVLANHMDGARLGVGTTLGTAALIWVVGLLAALAPSFRATLVPPALATRTA